MKRIIPLLAMMFLLAGCGNKATGNQGAPMNSPAKKPASSTKAGINQPPVMSTVTNAPAVHSNKTKTTNPPTTNRTPDPRLLS